MAYPLPSLNHLSFSVHVKPSNKKDVVTFDLTAKDEYEFDLWVTGIKALNYHWRRLEISKMTLLSHSRAFNEKIREK